MKNEKAHFIDTLSQSKTSANHGTVKVFGCAIGKKEGDLSFQRQEQCLVLCFERNKEKVDMHRGSRC